MKSVLYCLTKTISNYPLEMIDMVMVSGVFDQPTAVVFLDDGVRQLFADGEALKQKDVVKALSGLSSFDINEIFVERESLQERNLPETALANFISPIDRPTIKLMFTRYDIVVTD